MSEDYYPWQIAFSQRQIKWLLASGNWDAIRDGRWPFSISDNILCSANVSQHAYFELISLIKIELEMRLQSVGRDGEMCLRRFHDEYSYERIAEIENIPIFRIPRRIKRAMRYMRGKERKEISYNEWIKNGWSERPIPKNTPSCFD